MTATDPSGNTSEFSQAVGTDHPPVAVLGFTTRTVNEGQAVFFDGTGSHDPDGNALTYSWSLAMAALPPGRIPIHTYRQPGTFTVTLTVNDGYGATNAMMATMIVNNVAPSFVPGSFEPPMAEATPRPATVAWKRGGGLGERGGRGRSQVRYRSG